jgi:hypothetical protein
MMMRRMIGRMMRESEMDSLGSQPLLLLVLMMPLSLLIDTDPSPKALHHTHHHPHTPAENGTGVDNPVETALSRSKRIRFRSLVGPIGLGKRGGRKDV